MITLTQIAQTMRFEAKQRGNAQRTLSGGLELRLLEREKDIVLSISRPMALVAPSDGEIAICKKAFFGDEPLKEVNGQTHIWAKRKCYIAIEKEGD